MPDPTRPDPERTDASTWRVKTASGKTHGTGDNETERLKKDMNTLGGHLADAQQAVENQQVREAELQGRIEALQRELADKEIQIQQRDEEERVTTVQHLQQGEDIAALTKQVQSLQEKTRAGGGALADARRKAERAERELTRREVELQEQSRATKDELNRHVASLQQQLESRSLEYKAQAQSIDKLSSELDSAGREKESLRQELTEAKQAVTAARKAKPLRAADQEQAETASKAKSVAKEAENLRRQVAELEARTQELQRARARVDAKLDAAVTSLEAARQERKRSSDELAERAREAADTREQLKELEAQRGKLEQNASRESNRVAELEKELNDLKSAPRAAAAQTPRVTIVKKPINWHVRLEDGSVYGPVSVIELREWASQCRLYPGHMLSRDREKWQPAESLPELGMEWQIELEDGSLYGPLNLFAVRDLLDSGAITPSARVSHVKRKLNIEAGRIPPPEIAAVISNSTGAALTETDENAQTGKWHLKLEDGSVMGPVTISELENWATQCRVYPGHEVSQDGKTWGPAQDIPQLGMEWMVTLVNGESFGPLNIFAVPDLVGEGAVEAEAKVYHQTTRLEIPAGSVPTPELLELVREPEAVEEIERLETPQLVAELESARARNAELERQLTELRGRATHASEHPAAPPVAKQPPLSIKAQLKKRRESNG